MSVRTVSVGMLNPTKILESTSYLEAPPFYTELRLKLTISGSRSYTDGRGVTQAENLSYSKEITLDRVPMELSGATPSSQSAAGGLTTFGFDYADFTLSEPAAGYFSLATERWDVNFVAQQIGRQTLQPFYDPNFTAEVCGTWSETGNADPTDNDSGDIEISAFPVPIFWLSTAVGYPDDYRTPADRWGTTIIVPTRFGSPSGTMDQVDLSGWTNAQWRSKLGINSVDYTETTWGIAGSTTDVTATFEWELS